MIARLQDKEHTLNFDEETSAKEVMLQAVIYIKSNKNTNEKITLMMMTLQLENGGG